MDKQNVCKLLAIRDEKTIPIICVQEHFLLRSNSYKVKQCLPDNHLYFKSAVMDSDLGRPKNGMFIAVPSEIKENVKARGGGVWPKKIDSVCLDIFYYLSYVGSGTFYRNEKSSLVVE